MDAVNERQATKINEAKKDAEEEMQMISRLM